MGRTKREIRETRERLALQLDLITAATDKINEELSGLPHPRGQAQLSLKSKSGQFIVHTDKHILAGYTDSTGRKYEINISRVGRLPYEQKL